MDPPEGIVGELIPVLERVKTCSSLRVSPDVVRMTKPAAVSGSPERGQRHVRAMDWCTWHSDDFGHIVE